MRFFVEIAYNGTKYVGWQNQPNGVAVQQVIEHQFSLLDKYPISILGCGRTDTGVHASCYFFHFDSEMDWTQVSIQKLNGMLPSDITLKRILSVNDEAHARFDASSRSYTYFVTSKKNPFNRRFEYQYLQYRSLDFEPMKEACLLILQHQFFTTFCKTNNDAKTMRCNLSRLEIEIKEGSFCLHITSDRFLRGMVRLIVGALLNIGVGKVTLGELKEALDNQIRIKQNWSVPPHGLFLTDVEYPYIPNESENYNFRSINV